MLWWRTSLTKTVKKKITYIKKSSFSVCRVGKQVTDHEITGSILSLCIRDTLMGSGGGQFSMCICTDAYSPTLCCSEGQILTSPSGLEISIMSTVALIHLSATGRWSYLMRFMALLGRVNVYAYQITDSRIYPNPASCLFLLNLKIDPQAPKDFWHFKSFLVL